MRADGRDEWQTPDEVYKLICAYWGLEPQIDVCAIKKNTKCAFWFTPESDAIMRSWIQDFRDYNLEPIAWMNPPYSQPAMTQFIKKAIEETKSGVKTVFLLPAWVDQSWYHDYISFYDHVFWRGRIKFIPPPGIKPSSPRYGNIHGVIR